jgi:hypothetical protein
MTAISINITDFRKQLPGSLTDPTTYTFPSISTTNSFKKSTSWTIKVRVLNTKTKKFETILDKWFDSTPLPDHLQAQHQVDFKTVTGKIRDSDPTIVATGKNLGKANATNAFTQALRDALSLYNKKNQTSTSDKLSSDKTADQTSSGPPTPKIPDVPDELDVEPKPEPKKIIMYPPMLAQDLSDISHEKQIKLFGLKLADKQHINEAEITKPVWCDTKLDGIRAVAVVTLESPIDHKVTLYSRTMKEFVGNDHIKEGIAHVARQLIPKLPPGLTPYFDGEGYLHGKTLQDISGVMRRGVGSYKLEFHLFDIFFPERPEMPFSERLKYLDMVEETQYIKILVKHKVNRYSQMVDLYKRAIADKYEGLMIRFDSPYIHSYNSRHTDQMLKMKPEHDAEFTVVGYTKGSKGKSAGTLIMIASTNIDPAKPNKEPEEFHVKIRNKTIPETKELYDLMSKKEANGKTHFDNHYLGKQLRIYYQDLSDDNVPLRANTELYVREKGI